MINNIDWGKIELLKTTLLQNNDIIEMCGSIIEFNNAFNAYFIKSENAKPNTLTEFNKIESIFSNRLLFVYLNETYLTGRQALLNENHIVFKEFNENGEALNDGEAHSFDFQIGYYDSIVGISKLIISYRFRNQSIGILCVFVINDNYIAYFDNKAKIVSDSMEGILNEFRRYLDNSALRFQSFNSIFGTNDITDEYNLFDYIITIE
ncbi:hypothetical protein OX284_005030 [Flavobacterium sp. SUN046]|uniref:hypothetical protein n=1 Tax=Flavobacterium sp. SUN046 TaxID=3002440 RepID=UPI002DB9DFBF|nr:hypothetical protein [Flavobacterium sp. SUN046]MEC4048785.1 hypothetical protein [Flavobacterium sp. SUN046]